MIRPRTALWIGAFAVVVGASRVVGIGPGADAGADAPDARRVALLIGISDYRHFDVEGPPGQTDLRGPLNDVERIRKSLERFGFAGDDVRILRDAEASKAGIAEGFRWVAGRARNEADSVVIFYSGHGSFARDLDGDEAVTTPGDTLDEGLVPWDAADVHDPGQLVLDDQIRSWLAAIPTANVTVIVDACYSGTATRGDASATAKGPPALDAGGAAAMDLFAAPGHVLLTASSPREVAWEFEPSGSDLTFGKLTYYLTQAIDDAGPTTRYDEVMGRVGRMIASSGSPSQRQTPQLEGDRGARLFHVGEDLPRRPYVVVTPTGGGFEIDAGAVHGVRESALYDIHGPGETTFRGSPLATIRIDSVGLHASRAVRMEGAGEIPTGARATPALVPPGVERVERIDVHLESDARALAPELAALDFVRIVAGGQGSDARISRNGDAFLVWVGADSLPPRTADVSAGFTVTDPSTGGALGYRGRADALCSPLRRAFSIASFEAIENVVDPGWLDVRLAFVPVSGIPRATFAPDTVVIGREYGLFGRVDVADPQRRNIYLTVAIEGYTSAPQTIWPGADRMNRPVALNQWNRLLRLGWTKPAGAEKLIAIAGPAQFDLHSLVRSFPTCDTVRTRPRSDDEFRSPRQPAAAWQAFRHTVFIVEP